MRGDVEVVDGVAEVVVVGEHTRALRRGHVESQAVLTVELERLHAELHHTLADRRGVDEAGEMANEILH